MRYGPCLSDHLRSHWQGNHSKEFSLILALAHAIAWVVASPATLHWMIIT
jgi:hypothetical protein